jgi:large subunit ribosomal protein L23
MNSISSQHIILKPIITEKALIEQSKGKYSFWVGKKSNKNQIEQAFEMVFGVKPLAVNTIIIKGKMKTDWKKRKPIKKSDQKKAIITVAKDQKIELLTINNK